MPDPDYCSNPEFGLVSDFGLDNGTNDVH